MIHPMNRVAQQLRCAQDASDKLSAFVKKSADAGRYLGQIAKDLEEALALAEASLMAARPSLTDQVMLGSTKARPGMAPQMEAITLLAISGARRA